MIIPLLHILFVAFLILKFRKIQPEGIHAFYALLYFVLKCFCGFAVLYVFQKFYKQGDTIGYFKEAGFIYNEFLKDPFQLLKALFGADHNGVLKNLELWNNWTYNPVYNDNRTLILINVLIRFISFGQISVHIIWINFIAYLGLVWLYDCFIAGSESRSSLSLRNFSLKLSAIKPVHLLVFIPFFLPNVLVWGSALLKEPLVLFALGGLLRSTQLLLQKYSLKNLTWFVISFLFFMMIKPYLLLILFPGIISLAACKIIKNSKPVFLFLSVYLFGLAFLLITGNYFPAINLPAYLFGQQLSFIRNAIFSGASSFVFPVLFAPSPISFLKHIPEAISFCFLRPWPWELTHWWTYPLALDSFIVFVIFVYQLIKGKLKFLFNSPTALLALSTAIILFIFLGYTVPVMGNLLRYKMPGMLLLCLVFVMPFKSMPNEGKKEK
jgi:hypothetical protein